MAWDAWSREGRNALASSQLLGVLALVLLAGCEETAEVPREQPSAALDRFAEEHVKLALALRPFDGDYVDAYFGPQSWASAADPRSLSELRTGTARLMDAVRSIGPLPDPTTGRRRAALEKRLRAMLLRMDMAAGSYLAFDDESAMLFDAVAPDRAASDFADALAEIDALLPGEGPLANRLETFRSQFVIPKERLAAVMQAAIDECRRRTLRHIELPMEERFTLEFVTDQPWSGYNWYKGDYYSVIQINTDLPIYVDRAVDLGCHEGYPGHHTYNVIVEQRLVIERGWVEFTLNPLYGPQSLISEGSANYGIDLAFPGDERRSFEKQVIFPLAGLDPARADQYYDIEEALAELDYAGNEAARDYLNGQMDREAARRWLETYTLATPERAAQRVRFFDKYRSYVINYNFGRDLVETYIERRAGADPARRWQDFEQLLTEPIAAGDLL